MSIIHTNIFYNDWIGNTCWVVSCALYVAYAGFSDDFASEYYPTLAFDLDYLTTL